MTHWDQKFKMYHSQGFFSGQNLPYFAPDSCVFCGKYLSEADKQPPPGFVTLRPGHVWCYDNLIYNDTWECIACGESIAEKIGLQRSDRRNLLHRMHSDDCCIAWFAYKCACCFGMVRPQVSCQVGLHNGAGNQDFIEADFEEVEKVAQKAIEYRRQPTVNDMVNQTRLKSLGRSANFLKAPIRRTW